MRKKLLAVAEAVGLGLFVAGVSGVFGWSIPVALIGTGAVVVAAVEVRGG